MKVRRKAMAMAMAVAMAAVAATAEAGVRTATFEELALAPQSYWNGSDLSGGFYSGQALFANAFTDWGYGFVSWAGFACSNVDAPDTPGLGNQYAVVSGTGFGGCGNYAIGYDDAWSPDADFIALPGPSQVRGFYVNNTAYAALSMMYGDAFTKKFGGADGSEPDWFRLTVTGRDAAGAVIGSVDVYLADFRADDPADDYILSDWTWVDLTALGARVQRLEFHMDSSDVGAFGVNTPTYFAMDNLEYVAGDEWARRSDLAVEGLALAGSAARPRIDVALANLGGIAGTGQLVLFVTDTAGRMTLVRGARETLKSGARRTVSVFMGGRVTSRSPAVASVRAVFMPARAGSEITLWNNDLTEVFAARVPSAYVAQ